MGSSMESTVGSNREPLLCHCEVRARIYTSRTESNPGRRFYGCPYYKVSNPSSGCGFFRWFDVEICPRGKKIILQLARKNEKMVAREKIYQTMLVISWVLLAICIFALIHLQPKDPKSVVKMNVLNGI